MGFVDTGSGVFVHTAQAQHDPTALLRLVASRLTGGGYHLTGQGPGWLTAFRPAIGYGFSTNQALNFTVECDGWNVTFRIAGAGAGFRGDLNVAPFFTRAVGETLLAYDSWMVQHALSSYDAPQSQRAPVSHVIERQVVVARCKFCRAMTPVDAPTCQHCGAASFS